MPPQIGREEKELRYKISVDTADLETTFARLDQRVSAAISGMGMRPLDIFTTAERRLEIAEAISVPYAGRRLAPEERRAIAEVTIPETLMQYIPGVPTIFGGELIARQQQSVAAAGILRQTGQRITSANIEELMGTMRRIDVDMPGIRATDVAMAASFLQAMPGAIRGLPKQEVESRIRDIVQSQEVLRETFGLTKESQVREMMMPFVQMDMAHRAGAVSQLAASVSQITNRPETESLSNLFTAGGIAEAHRLPFEFGAGAYFIAQAAVETAIRDEGLHGAELRMLGGPTGAAMSIVNQQAEILKSPQTESALALMSEKTGGKFDPTLFRQLMGKGVRATREVLNNFNAHRFDIYEQAAENTGVILDAYLDERSARFGSRDAAIRAHGNLYGSQKMARALFNDSAISDQVFTADRNRLLAELRPKDLGIFGAISEFAREATSIGGLALSTQIGYGVDYAISSARTAFGITEAKEQSYYVALYPKAGDVTVGGTLGGEMESRFAEAVKDSGISENEVKPFFTKDSKTGNVTVDIQALTSHGNKFGKDDLNKKVAWSAATQIMSDVAGERLVEDFGKTIDINAFKNYILQDVPGKEFSELMTPEALLRQPIFRVSGEAKEEAAKRLSERPAMAALALADLYAEGELIRTPEGQRRVRVPERALVMAARARETKAPIGGVTDKGAGEAAARDAADALLRFANALGS